MNCEVKGKKQCKELAFYKVRHRDHSEKESFLVCEKHISAYKFVPLKEHGQKTGSFIVKQLAGEDVTMKETTIAEGIFDPTHKCFGEIMHDWKITSENFDFFDKIYKGRVVRVTIELQELEK